VLERGSSGETEFVSSVAMCVTEFMRERESRFLRETNPQFLRAREFGREGEREFSGDLSHQICQREGESFYTRSNSAMC